MTGTKRVLRVRDRGSVGADSGRLAFKRREPTDLLVFASRSVCEELQGPGNCAALRSAQRPVLSQTIWRIREPTWQGSCPAQKATFEGPPQFRPGPCQQLATEPGPFVPNDVDRGRVVAIGDNALVVLDSNGARLLTIPIKAAAAQLSGSDLVVLVQGQLRRHDAETGALVNSWQVPDVRSAGPCEEDYVCNSIQLRLQDTTHGLVAYLLDGNLHLLRLSDGADAILHNATAARFSATGLFYAYQAPNPWQGRIRFLAYEQLPLR